MTGPYIKPTQFSGSWVNLRYDQTPINYWMQLSATPSSVADSIISYYPSGTPENQYNTKSYSFNRKRYFLENSEAILPGPLNENRVSELESSKFATSSEDIMYNSNFYELRSSSSIIKVEVAKRVPHIFSLQFSSTNNTRYIPLIIRPFGASFGFNAKVFENTNLEVPGYKDSKEDINAVTGTHFHNPTYDSYLAYKDPYMLPEDREVGLGSPMFSKVYFSNSSSMVFYGAIRPFDFISASGESRGTYWSEKGTGSFANPVFWQGIIMVQDFNFNWAGIEGVHKIKQYYYNPVELLGVSAGQHRSQVGIDWYFTNTFNNGYIYRPDYVVGSETPGYPATGALYDINKYIFRPSNDYTGVYTDYGITDDVTGITIQDINYSGLFTSGAVINIDYVCNSSIYNDVGAPALVADQAQGLWHNVYHYNYNNNGGIVVDRGKWMTSTEHPYISSVYTYTTAPVFVSGLYNGWNTDPAYPFSQGEYGPKSGQGKPYVCPILELNSPNPYGISDKVCVGVYTKLTPKPEITNRPNIISVGQRREQICARQVWNKSKYYRPTTPETVPSPYDAGLMGPFTYEDVNGGAYINIYTVSNKNFPKGWIMLEYWMVIAETKEQVISKIDLLHSMGAAEPGPAAPEIELPKAVYDSVLAYPIRGTL